MTFLLFLLIAVCIRHPVPVRADDGLQYQMSEDGTEAYVTGYMGNGPEVEIPDTVWNRPVTVIKEGAFTGNKRVQAFVFGKNLRTIERYSCNRMRNLTRLSIPGNVTKIGMSAFMECERLGELVFEDGAKELTLVCYAFDRCASLQRIDFGRRPIRAVSYDGNTGGSGSLFYGAAVTEVVIPATTDLTPSAFSYCTSMRRVTVDAEEIDYYMFNGCEALEEVTIKNAKSIDKGAFSGCSSLRSLSLPDALTTLGSGAFSSCSSLEQISLPESLQSIATDAFSACSSLKAIAFPSQITEISARCLKGCSALCTVSLPDGLTRIGTEAFEDCSSLSSITVPAPVGDIERLAFEGCSSLAQILVEEGNQAYVSVDGNLYDFGQTCLLRAAQQVEKIQLPATVTRIGVSACTGMQRISSYTIPAQVTEIGSRAFADGASLEQVSFADAGTELSLGGHAFENCTVLADVDFGTRSIMVENGYAFQNCGLVSVYLPGTVNTKNGGGMFRQCKNLEHVTIVGQPQGTSLFSDCINLKTAALDEVEYVPSHMFYGCSSLSETVLGEEIQSLGDYSFYQCGMETVTLPESLKEIGAHAFEDTKLTAIRLPKATATLSLTSFADCRELRQITVDEENPAYAAEQNALFDKEKQVLLYLPQDGYGLETISVPASVKKVSTRAFLGVQGVKWIAFEGTVPVGVYEPVLGSGFGEKSLSLSHIFPDYYLFYDESHPEWKTTPVVSVGSADRIAITGEMREIKAAMNGVDAKTVTSKDREALADLLERYSDRTAEEKVWLGSSENLEEASGRASGFFVKEMIQKLPGEDELTEKDRDSVRDAKQEYDTLGQIGRSVVGNTLASRLQRTVSKMKEILSVKEITPDRKEIRGLQGQTIRIQISVLPDCAENRTLRCEIENLEILDYTLDQEEKTLTLRLKKEGSTSIVLSAEDGSGVETRIPVEIRLSEPEGISAKQYEGTAEIKWQAVEGAASYRIFCSVDGAKFKECGNTPTLIFVYSGLQEGRTYQFRVAAISGQGFDSEMSKEAATIAVASVGGGQDQPPQQESESISEARPDKGENQQGGLEAAASKKAPGKFRAVKKGGRKVKLSWKKVDGASGYQIFRSRGKRRRYTIIKTLNRVSKVTYTDKHLKKRAWFYKVRAFWREGSDVVYGKWSKIRKASLGRQVRK